MKDGTKLNKREQIISNKAARQNRNSTLKTRRITDTNEKI
jgi:hypothetical protein